MTDNKVYVGIDVSKDKLDVAIHQSTQHWSVSNNKKGIDTIKAKLSKLEPELVVVESTNTYHVLVATALALYGVRVAVINPWRSHKFASAMGFLAKTDKVDARSLAHYAAVAELRLYRVPTAEEQQLRELVTRRDQLVQMRTMEKNRLHEASEKTRESIKELIDHLNLQIKALDAEIKERIQANPKWRELCELLRSIKGVGPVTCFTIIAHLPEIGQVNRRQIAALAGVAPFNHDSGKLKGKRAIWGGRAQIRKVLYMAVVSACRSNPAIRDHYQQLRARGKAIKVARVACMRKLLVIMNTIVKTGQPFDPAYATAA